LSIKIKELPELERPYEKLEWYGEKSLSNAELLAIIIKTGNKEETAVQLAQRVLNLNNDKTEGLNFLKNVTLEELMSIKGIGKVKAIQLKAIGEITNRMIMPINTKRIRINTPGDLAKIVMEELRFRKKEILKIVLLNSKNQVLKIEDLSIGSINFAHIQIRDILELPIKMNAPKIILIHNHPSGDPSPSRIDIEFTKDLCDITSHFGIELLDHLVIGCNTYTSIFSVIFKNTKDNKHKA